MQKFTLFLLLLLLIGASSTSWAQDKLSISGIVTGKGKPLSGVQVTSKLTKQKTSTDAKGIFTIATHLGDTLAFSYLGFETEFIAIKEGTFLKVDLRSSQSLNEIVVVNEVSDIAIRGYASNSYSKTNLIADYSSSVRNTESYARIDENQFEHVGTNPLSTFSVDVDRAAYSNIRRMINAGQKIPVDAVRIEEMINYFNYSYKQPDSNEPFSIQTEQAQTPWNADTQLVKIGIQGKEIPVGNLPPSNLVFLLDVSGSMNSPNKLPLLKSAFKILVNQLREQDKVSIVVYAGSAGTVLKPTNGSNKTEILNALDNLKAGGSTAGEEGLKLAYTLAENHFVDGGNNRIILATDGDFNVGLSSDREMENLITEKRNSGIYFTALGFGMGNYKDSKLELLANKGNGNYAYIDTMQEAQKVLGTEFGGTLHTIAKDVKIQVEFNPAVVSGYRLIGYENRLLNDADFNDDTKDAGEIGSGHSVTALYEVLLAGKESKFLKPVDDLKYTNTKAVKPNSKGELFTVKLRYKEPDGEISKLIEKAVSFEDKKIKSTSDDFNFVTSLALFGMQLRDSPFKNDASLALTLDLAEKGRGDDKEGFRAEFIRLVKASN
ncbi:vWA domain-containing protein [Leeuwenhoekiella aequorea]|uniref:Ca-activated chloride channel family protein n=1 Tax=Leeuwenhoekiella aequorea TaxID=283736 RepID=A0A4Q0PDN2_9FLAO|nr:VWA domain-containing protein [Leeuwenhoekiella aequorea]RXG24954.1 Ca-activated chloride channel family protein [Leeuwenhoekiella aequorea]